MRVMGIDASTTCTGWAIFDDNELIGYGAIRPDGDNWRDRLVNEGPVLSQVIKKYSPTKIYMEDVPLKSQNPKALVILGAVQGFIYGIASSFEVPIEFVMPNEWRSPLNLYDGTREGTKRTELKRKAVAKANDLFGLNLAWVSPSSKKNEDDLAEAILICYSQIGKKRFGKPKSH